MSEIAQELVDRMATLVREIAARYDVEPLAIDQDTAYQWMRAAASCAALLPKPVDPDLIEAREIVYHYRMDGQPNGPWKATLRRQLAEGQMDNDGEVLCACRAVKRGRELERSSS